MLSNRDNKYWVVSTSQALFGRLINKMLIQWISQNIFLQWFYDHSFAPMERQRFAILQKTIAMEQCVTFTITRNEKVIYRRLKLGKQQASFEKNTICHRFTVNLWPSWCGICVHHIIKTLQEIQAFPAWEHQDISITEHLTNNFNMWLNISAELRFSFVHKTCIKTPGT